MVAMLGDGGTGLFEKGMILTEYRETLSSK
jgi:hypothetical protein